MGPNEVAISIIEVTFTCLPGMDIYICMFLSAPHHPSHPAHQKFKKCENTLLKDKGFTAVDNNLDNVYCISKVNGNSGKSIGHGYDIMGHCMNYTVYCTTTIKLIGIKWCNC